MVNRLIAPVCPSCGVPFAIAILSPKAGVQTFLNFPFWGSGQVKFSVL
jgi:hypothetical protein